MGDRETNSGRAVDLMRVFEDSTELAEGVAAHVAETLSVVIGRRGSASLVLSGGSTPKESYQRLAAQDLDWSRIDVFWGDERCVPQDDRASNYRMAREALLEPAGVPADRVHRIRGEAGALAGAESYERLLRRRFTQEWPEFDVVLLGVGTDGHVASVFPGDDQAQGGEWVVPVRRQPPDTDRVSLALDALVRARHLLVLASGSDKARIVARARAAEDRSLPVVGLVRDARALTWWLDRAAAGSE